MRLRLAVVTVAVTSLLASAAEAQDYDDAYVVAYDLPTAMTAGSSYAAWITLHNSGTSTWDANYRLGAVGDRDDMGGPGRVYLPPGVTVPPEGEYTFYFTLTAPNLPGDYLSDWQMVHEYVAWFGSVLATNVLVTVPVGDGAEVVAANLPSSLACGQDYQASVTMKNTGGTTWSESAMYRLGAVGDSDAVGGPGRVYLESGLTVPPGGTHQFQFWLHAPGSAGTYRTDWRMLQEYVTWFGATAAQDVSVQCTPQVNPGVVPDPNNPLYFIEQQLQSRLLLTGFGSIVTPQYSRHYDQEIAALRAAGVRYARVWMLTDPADMRPWVDDPNGPYVWSVTLPSGGSLYKRWSWNPTFWSRLTDALARADSASASQVLYSEIHLFEKDCIGWEFFDPDGSLCGTFRTPGSVWAPLQDLWVDKLLAETSRFKNVFYEIENEPAERIGPMTQEPLKGWHNRWAARIPKTTPVVRALSVVVTPDTIPNIKKLAGFDVTLFDVHPSKMDADLSSLASAISEFVQLGKAVSVDEFGNSVCLAQSCDPGGAGLDTLRRMAWTAVANGAHFHIEDIWGDPNRWQPDPVQPLLRNVEAFKGNWEFWRFRPSGDPVVTAAGNTFHPSCLRATWPAQGDKTEYVCYVPEVPAATDRLEVTLPTSPPAFGAWQLYLWNPRGTSGVYDAHYRSVSPTRIVVDLPSSDPSPTKRDWVLHVDTDQVVSYPLTVARSGSGNGLVTSAPAGIDCGSTCTASYSAGTTVRLTAAPASGAGFSGWTGDCQGTALTCDVQMAAARTVGAAFQQVTGGTLTVTRTGTGTGTVTSQPAGIDCGADCSESYAAVQVVILTASPAPGSTFGGWGGACSGSGTAATCQVTVSGAVTVSASFPSTQPPANRPPVVSVTAARGTCHPTPTTPCTVTCTATASDPDGDPLIYQWSGCASGAGATAACTVPDLAAHACSVQVSDGRGGTTTSSATVTGVNSPPSCVANNGQGMTVYHLAWTGNVPLTITDPDGDSVPTCSGVGSNASQVLGIGPYYKCKTNPTQFKIRPSCSGAPVSVMLHVNVSDGWVTATCPMPVTCLLQ